MAIIKEDGTGLSNANVYADIADLDAYALLRNEDLTSYDTAQKEAALYVSAQDWIDGEHSFIGTKLNETQGLKMPTSEVTLPDSAIVNTNCLAAILQLKGLLFEEVQANTAGQIKSKETGLSVMKKKIEYFQGTTVKPDTSVISNMLLPYTSGNVPSFSSNFSVN